MKNLKMLNQTIKLTTAFSFLLIAFVFIKIPENAATTLVENSASETANKIKTVTLTGSFHFSEEMDYRDSVFYDSSDSNSDSVIQSSDFDSILKSIEAIINFTTGKDKNDMTEDSQNSNKKASQNSNKKDLIKSSKKDSNKSNNKESKKNGKKKPTITKQKKSKT